MITPQEEKDCLKPKSVSYVIPGRPVAWARARVNFHVNRHYDSQKSLKISSGLYLTQCHGNNFPFQGPLHADIKFFFHPPKSFSLKKRKSLFNKPDISHIDLDNLIKFLLDTLQNSECQNYDLNIIEDDCMITSIIAQKTYTDGEERTELTLTEIL